MKPPSLSRDSSPVPWLLPVALALLMFVLPAAPAGGQDGRRVDDIRFQGLITWQPQQLIERLQTRVGRTYRTVLIQQDLRDLARIMRTVRVETEPSADGGVIVRFVVTEYPRLERIQVIGNESVETERVERLATEVGLQPGSMLSDQSRRRLRLALLREYRALGMPQTRIRLNAVDTPQPHDAPGQLPRADLQILINEGEQILCKDLILEGNDSFSDLRLKHLIETKGSFLFLKHYFDEETFRRDLDRLRRFYEQRGFFDARIERGLFQVGTDTDLPREVSPRIRIHEGERYRFGQAAVRGARLFSPHDVLEPLRVLEGDPFDGDDLQKALERVRSMYFDHGLLTTRFSPEFQYDRQRKRVDLVLRVEEGRRIHVGEIKLKRPRLAEAETTRGLMRWYTQVAPRLKQQVVAREVLLEPGQIYNKRLERQSRARLARLGVFEPDTLSVYNQPSGVEGVHDLLVEAEDAPTGMLNAGIGFSDYAGGFIFASHNERNLGGEANVLSVRGQLGSRVSAASVSYLDRHLGDSRDSLRASLFYDMLGRPGYRAQLGGLHTQWTRPLRHDRWHLSLRGRLEWVSLDERSGYHPRENLDHDYGVATLRLMFEQDYLGLTSDRPRNGYQQAAALEAGYAGAAMLKLTGSREQFWPLTDKLTAHLVGRAALMPYEADHLPIHERLFMGGSTDLRGFAYRGAGYWDLDDEDVPVGGAAKALLRNELIYDIRDPVAAVLFTDLGALGNSPVDWQRLRWSAGAGLRLDLQNVEVALDLALPILSGEDDETQFFHFSLNSEF